MITLMILLMMRTIMMMMWGRVSSWTDDCSTYSTCSLQYVLIFVGTGWMESILEKIERGEVGAIHV